MTSNEDPLALIAEEVPQFSDDEAISIVRDIYGLDVSVRSLVSERDQNFQLQATDGKRFVLKIASKAEPRQVTEFQISGLLHIADHVAEHGTPINAPTVLKTLDGNSHTILTAPNGEHVARVVGFVDGDPIGDRIPTADLCRNMGVYLAHLGNALRDFEHPGCDQNLLWDLQQALSLRDLLKHIPHESLCNDVAKALDDFEAFALPGFSDVRRQVIHSDFNPDNVLVDPERPDVVVGVIDFGDMLAAPLIADVAIGAAYAQPHDGNPLELIAEFLAGYHAVTPLEQQEVDMLFELVKARLCTSIVLRYWRASFREPGDPYLEKLLASRSTSEDFLLQLSTVPRDNAIQMFRQVCASVDER
jgi:Ser/Thr protein kinase RdoA (MazF antagonist)